METNKNHDVFLGHRLGLIFFIIALVLVGINALLLHLNEIYFPKIFVLGLAFGIVSPILFIFPGTALEKIPKSRDWYILLWKQAPFLHRAMWITWTIISILFAVFVLMGLEPEF